MAEGLLEATTSSAGLALARTNRPSTTAEVLVPAERQVPPTARQGTDLRAAHVATRLGPMAEVPPSALLPPEATLPREDGLLAS